MAHLIRALDPSVYTVGAVSLYDSQGSELDTMVADSGIPVWYLGKRKGFDPRMFGRVDAVVRQFRPRVVHTHLGALPYALPAALRRHVPARIHTIHRADELAASGPVHWFQRAVFKRWVAPAPVARSICTSLGYLEGLDRVHPVLNGIPVAYYRNPAVGRCEWRERHHFSAEDVLFVCTARLAIPKNHSLLLAAFARGPARHPRAQLLLAGDGDQCETLQRQAGELGIAPRVHFLGLRLDIPDVLGACDIFVLASHIEGNPLSLMEAMAAGLPVISTAVGGVPEVVREGIDGLLVAPGDAVALSEAMLCLLEHAEGRREMARNATLWALEHFDMSMMAQAYSDLYQAELNSRPGNGIGRRA